MARKDYAHHNEEAEAMWWLEEGRFAGQEDDRPDVDDFYDDDPDADAWR